MIVADAGRVAELTNALVADELAGWASRQTDPVIPLVALPPR